MKRWQMGMRDSFFKSLYNLARKDKRILLVTSDTGAICHDEFKNNLRNQYINIGIAEQNMIGVAAGLAMSGKIVYVYAIVPFATMRCYEQIRVDLCCMNLGVTIVGIGAGFDYSTLGPTHHGTEDIALMRSLPEMTVYSPSDSLMAEVLAEASYRQPGPKYIRLDRVGYPLLYAKRSDINVAEGFSLLKPGKDMYIIATGRMVYNALAIRRELSRESIGVGVIDLFRIEESVLEKIWPVIAHARCAVTLEEHFVRGGIGSAVSELLAVKRGGPEFRAIGIANRFCRKYGTREYLQRLNKIDQDSIVKSIRTLLKKQSPVHSS